jgi:hypothetical protein
MFVTVGRSADGGDEVPAFGFAPLHRVGVRSEGERSNVCVRCVQWNVPGTRAEAGVR